MDPIVYNKIMCSLMMHNFRGKHTIPQQPNIIFPRAAYGRLQARRAFVHPNIRAKYEGYETQRPNHPWTPTHSRTTRSLPGDIRIFHRLSPTTTIPMEDTKEALGLVIRNLSDQNYEQSLPLCHLRLDIGQSYHQNPP